MSIGRTKILNKRNIPHGVYVCVCIIDSLSKLMYKYLRHNVQLLLLYVLIPIKFFIQGFIIGFLQNKDIRNLSS